MIGIGELRNSARTRQPITLPIARGLTGVCMVFFVAATLALIFQLPSAPISGSLEILGFGFLLFCGFMALRPGATYIAIDAEGIVRCITFQNKFIRWSEVRSIRVGWLGYERALIAWNRQVLIDYRRDDKNELCAIFPHMFGLNAEELMSLLSPYYEHARRELIAPDGKIAAAA